MPYGLMPGQPEEGVGQMAGQPEQIPGQLMQQPMGGPAWDPSGSMGVNPYQGLPQPYQALDAEYHALHEEEAAHKLEELDRASKFRRALGMITETFATIAGRDDIAALSRKQMEKEDEERAQRVQAQILAHVGMRALERERSETSMEFAKLASGEERARMTQEGLDRRHQEGIESRERIAGASEASEKARHEESMALRRDAEARRQDAEKRRQAEAKERADREARDREEKGKPKSGFAKTFLAQIEKQPAGTQLDEIENLGRRLKAGEAQLSREDFILLDTRRRILQKQKEDEERKKHERDLAQRRAKASSSSGLLGALGL